MEANSGSSAFLCAVGRKSGSKCCDQSRVGVWLRDSVGVSRIPMTGFSD